MARTYTISDGTTTINLLNESGFIPSRFGGSQFPVDVNLPPGHMRFVDNYTMNLYSTDQDDAATQLQELFRLLRKAHLFHATSWQNVPVYLTAQTGTETNTRYALVYGSPNVSMPDVFDIPFATADYLEDMALQVIRGVWRGGVPGTTPTAATLTKTSANADGTVQPVANFFDTQGITSIFNMSSDGTTFTSDLSLAQAITIYGSTYDSDFALFVGSSDAPLHNICFTLSSNRDGGDEDLYTFTTDAWVQATTNTGFLPQSRSSDWITSTDGLLGFRAASVRSGQDAAYTSRVMTATAINGVTAYWLRLEADDTPTTNAPANTTSDGIFTQNKPYIELSSDAINGDIPPMMNIRLWNAGQHIDVGSSDSRAWNVARIILGAKTDPGNFASHLNASGAGLPSTDWAVSYDTDTTGNGASTNFDANSPGGYRAECTFGATTQKTRVQWVGTDLLGDYRGEYKAFLRAEQVGGTDGDIGVALQIRVGSTDSYAPARLGSLVDLQTHDKGYELIDLGQFSIPFHEVADTDYVTADIILELQAAINTGSGQQLRIADLIFIPVDEWTMKIEDPISDNDLGTSALWGNQYIEYDSGVLGHKVGKYHLEKRSANAHPAENWFYSGKPYMVEPNKKTRIYFLMGHWHPDLGWGVEPLVSDPSSLLAVEVRPQPLYLSLRGSE